jgi:hypothetical protein
VEAPGARWASRAEDIHTVAASLIAMLRRETAGIVIG